MSDVSDDYTQILDGPVYERSQLMVDLLLPVMPTADEVHAEFRAHLHRSVDGVELVQAPAAQCIVTAEGEGAGVRYEQHERRKLYGRATFDVFDGMAAHGLGKVRDAKREAAFRADAADAVRGPVLALARRLAERVASQVVDLRAGRAHRRSAFAEPRLEPIIVSVHGTAPRLLGADFDAPLIGISHYTADAFAIFGAWYFVTPVSVEPKETPCPRP